MASGPKGERRSAGVSARAGVEDDGPPPRSDGKNPAAVALGRMGGKARAQGLSARKRKEIARKAAMTRWGSGAANNPPQCGLPFQPFRGGNLDPKARKPNIGPMGGREQADGRNAEVLENLRA